MSELRPVELAQVRRTADEGLFNSLMEEHHYLGYEQPVSTQRKPSPRSNSRFRAWLSPISPQACLIT